MEKQEESSSPLLNSDIEDLSSSDGSSFSGKIRSASDRRTLIFRRWCPLVLQASVLILLFLTIALLAILLQRRPTDKQCAAQTSLWSPAMEAVEYHEFDFSNAFDSQSIYRGPPTTELEDAWIKLTQKHGVQVPADKLAGLNRSSVPDLQHVPEDVGTGYVALIEVFHQLHCLNTVRQYTWLQAGKYDSPPGPLSSSDVGNRMHVDHCIETLRLALMCFADVTPLLMVLDPEAPIGKRADFNSHHKCRNFDKIEEWMDTNWDVL